MSDYEQQYLDRFRYVLSHGKWEWNERTQQRCLTVPRLLMEYKLDEKSIPLLTVRPSYPVSSFAELLGYIRQYEWASQFDLIGSKNWYKNANETAAWLKNENRMGANHLGKIYGAALNKKHIDEVFCKIEKGVDDRGLILNWWQPDMFEKGCLRPCLNQHTINFIGGKTYLTSTQRSLDMCCGWNYNSISIYILGMIIAKISGKEGENAVHLANNCHIYECHLNEVEELLSRKPERLDVKFKVNNWVERYSDLLVDNHHTRDYFTIEGYKGVPQTKVNFEMIA